MATVQGVAVRYVSDDFPGVIEVHLTDADGLVHSLVDKAPIFGRTDDIGPATTYPRPVDIGVTLVEHLGEDRALIELAWAEPMNTERTRYVVPRTDLRL